MLKPAKGRELVSRFVEEDAWDLRVERLARLPETLTSIGYMLMETNITKVMDGTMSVARDKNNEAARAAVATLNQLSALNRAMFFSALFPKMGVHLDAA